MTEKALKPRAPAAATARPAPEPFFRFAVIGIFLVTLLRLLWLAGQPIDLYPDEAQYWIWAQHLAWGYYSKPPVVAWMIRATTALFGENELAVKLGAPVTYVFTSVTVFLIARRLYDARIAAWSAIAFVTLPAVSLSSLIISTDVPLLLFWALATYGFVMAREPGRERWWLLVGLAGGFGLLSKYAMAFWLGSALLFLLLRRDERRHLRPFLTAALMAFVIYLPNLLWNWQHGFVSYIHTEANANVHGFALHPGAFLRFAGSQFLVFGPIFLATLVLMVARGRALLADARAMLLLTFALPTLCVMLVVALLSRAEPNWSAPTYVTATILVVAFLSARGREGLVQWSVVLHLGLAIAVLGVRDAAAAIGHPLPGRYDPIHRVLGWRMLGETIGQTRLRYFGLPVLGDEREFMSALIYYMQPHPFDMRMWNPGKGVHNGFEMSQSLPDEPGGDYLWITQRRKRDGVLSRFQSHELVSHIMVKVDPGLFREAWIYVLHGFEGYRPAHPPARQ